MGSRRFIPASNQYLEAADNPRLRRPTDAITICCWVWKQGSTTGGDPEPFSSILSKSTGTTSPWHSYTIQENSDLGGGRIQFVLSSGTSGSEISASTPSGLNVSTWYYLICRWSIGEQLEIRAYTWESSGWSLFTSALSASAKTTNIGYTNAPFRIARNESTSDWSGRIAHVIIFDRKLSLDEALGYGHVFTPDPSVVGYWPLLGVDSPEPDWGGGQTPLTVINNPTFAPGPPRAFGIPLQTFGPSVAGAQGLFLDADPLTFAISSAAVNPLLSAPAASIPYSASVSAEQHSLAVPANSISHSIATASMQPAVSISATPVSSSIATASMQPAVSISANSVPHSVAIAPMQPALATMTQAVNWTSSAANVFHTLSTPSANVVFDIVIRDASLGEEIGFILDADAVQSFVSILSTTGSMNALASPISFSISPTSIQQTLSLPAQNVIANTAVQLANATVALPAVSTFWTVSAAPAQGASSMTALPLQWNASFADADLLGPFLFTAGKATFTAIAAADLMDAQIQIVPAVQQDTMQIIANVDWDDIDG